jgi:hypothetical protein
MAVLDDIREQFPFLAWLVDDPEVGNLLNQAIDPNTTFSAQRFQAELMNTNWWRSQSEARRNWKILAHTDPAEAERQRAGFIGNLNYLSSQLGIQLSGPQQAWITELALQEGLEFSDPRIRTALANLVFSGEAGITGGAIDTLTKQIFHMGQSQYFLPITGNVQGDAYAWATHIAEGTKTMDDVEEEYRKRAISLYPHLAEELSGGATMQDLFSGHINVVADELELSPAEVNLTEGPWLKVIDMYDSNTNQHRPLSLSETRTLARQDQRFWSTAKGRQLDSQMTNNLLKTFGARR